MKKIPAIAALTAISAPCIAFSAPDHTAGSGDGIFYEPLPAELELDSLLMAGTMAYLYEPMTLRDDEQGMYLTEDDYREVAAELNIDVAAIKAVVDIETGNTNCGFWKPGKPILNFDITMYRKYAPRHGVDLNDARRRFPEIFQSPNVRKYGSKQAAQHARLEQAMEVNPKAAIEGAFWGMFQIGGFNWALCGCDSVEQFMERMSRSERDQLELFAAFCNSRDLTKYIRNHQWAEFSLRYNGPSYRSRGYHSRMARAFSKYSRRQ